MIEKVTLTEAMLSTAERGNVTNFFGTNGSSFRLGKLGLQEGELEPGKSVTLDAPRYRTYTFVEYSTVGVSAVISASYSIIAIIGGLGISNVSTKDEDGKISLIAGEDTITVKNNRSTKISYQLFKMV